MSLADITQLRKEYKQHELNEEDVCKNPVEQFKKWFEDGVNAQIDEPNAMTLCTTTAEGFPDARTVLLKGFDENGFVFYTNYNSKKSMQLTAQPNAMILFFWKELERQVRVYGQAEKLTLQENIAYFNSRPDGSKLGAWASPQSMVVAGKAWLMETFQFYKERFAHGEIPLPPHWGGYRIKPYQMEFWQGRPNRMHDRLLFTKASTDTWKIERLAP